jgi:DMSO reductase family type II enzyme heme b subunit
VEGKGAWENGKWSVVIHRALITQDKDDVQFVPGMETYFTVAVWNGSEGDRDGQKSISLRWNPINIERIKYSASAEE